MRTVVQAITLTILVNSCIFQCASDTFFILKKPSIAEMNYKLVPGVKSKTKAIKAVVVTVSGGEIRPVLGKSDTKPSGKAAKSEKVVRDIKTGKNLAKSKISPVLDENMTVQAEAKAKAMQKIRKTKADKVVTESNRKTIQVAKKTTVRHETKSRTDPVVVTIKKASATTVTENSEITTTEDKTAVRTVYIPVKKLGRNKGADSQETTCFVEPLMGHTDTWDTSSTQPWFDNKFMKLAGVNPTPESNCKGIDCVTYLWPIVKI